mmetsp:Transcript_107081/g.245103  ORF Transcript_107081/g.245103 Transcript_107081/m.245103 type:complete len:256 (-) Transcript_107081:1628-2395(-)
MYARARGHRPARGSSSSSSLCGSCPSTPISATAPAVNFLDWLRSALRPASGAGVSSGLAARVGTPELAPRRSIGTGDRSSATTTASRRLVAACRTGGRRAGTSMGGGRAGPGAGAGVSSASSGPSSSAGGTTSPAEGSGDTTPELSSAPRELGLATPWSSSVSRSTSSWATCGSAYATSSHSFILRKLNSSCSIWVSGLWWSIGSPVKPSSRRRRVLDAVSTSSCSSSWCTLNSSTRTCTSSFRDTSRSISCKRS